MRKLILMLGIAALALPVTAGAKEPPLSVQAMGKIGASTSSCSGIAQGCVSATGTFRGRPISNGTFSARFTVDWSKTVKTAGGATCARAGGTVELTAKNGDSLTLNETGKVCRGGGSSYPYRFSGTYSINLGAGKYQTAGVGSGKASFQFLPGNRLRAFAVGAFAMTGRPPV